MLLVLLVVVAAVVVVGGGGSGAGPGVGIVWRHGHTIAVVVHLHEVQGEVHLCRKAIEIR